MISRIHMWSLESPQAGTQAERNLSKKMHGFKLQDVGALGLESGGEDVPGTA